MFMDATRLTRKDEIKRKVKLLQTEEVRLVRVLSSPGQTETFKLQAHHDLGEVLEKLRALGQELFQVEQEQ